MNRLSRVGACVLACLVLAPSIAHAQASIAGVVRDASGAVLPGATVEASSPVLIEKVRSVSTDGSGQYQIVNLRPGLYTVTFSLSGFTTVRRENIELTGSKSAIVYKPLPEDDPQVRQPDITKAKEILGWEPKVDLDKGLLKTIEYFRSNLEAKKA